MDKCAIILTINPGSTSTKVAVYQNQKAIFLKTFRHQPEVLSQYNHVVEQLDFRKELIWEELINSDIDLTKIEAVIGRGGLLKPISSGVYRVNEAMIAELRDPETSEHASNLGALMAYDIACGLDNAQAFIADPVVVDELEPLARFSGHPEFERISIFHALNQKSIARTYANSIMREYEALNLIVVHLGGGITVGAHRKGRVIDVNQGLDGDGPFSPERSGTLPIGEVIKAAYSGKYSYKEMQRMVVGKGGMVAYTGTNDAYDVEKRAMAGDELCREVTEAMAYQVAKEVGAMSTVLKGDVDAILITGGIANSTWFCNLIQERIFKIAPVHIYPGEDEMRALADNARLALEGEIEIREYV